MYLHDKGEIGSPLAAPWSCLYRVGFSECVGGNCWDQPQVPAFFLLSCSPPATLLPIPAPFCQCMPRQPLWTGNQQETPQSISFIWQVSGIWQQQDDAAVWKLKRTKVLGENKNPSGSSYLIEKSGLGGEDYKDWTQQNHFKWPGNLSSGLLRRVCCPEARCYSELSLDDFCFKCISTAGKHRIWNVEF